MSSPKHIEKSTLYEFIKGWLNEGLLLSTGNVKNSLWFSKFRIDWRAIFSGKKWHDRRKIITPAFHFNILEKFVEIFDRLGNIVVDKLNTVSPDEPMEFYPIAVLYALDVMCGEYLLGDTRHWVNLKWKFQIQRIGDGCEHWCTVKTGLRICSSCETVSL